jgi:hypothetical protein
MRATRHLIVILGVVAAAALLVSRVSTSQTAESGWLALWPVCAAKRAGGSCGLCGMTHAFIAISHGRLDEARRVNPNSVPLYAGFLGLSLAALLAGAAGAGRRIRGIRRI